MVENTLNPYLETEHGFMLCIHNRNFLAGVSIISNIANAVDKSRRMIMMLTRSVHNSLCNIRMTDGQN